MFAAFVTLFSCQKEIAYEENNETATGTAIMTVNAGSIQSKTFLEAYGDNYNVFWSAGDQIAAFEVGNGVIAEAKTVSDALAVDSDNASFTLDFSGNTALEANYSYVFVYPASLYSVNDGKTKYRALIPNEQTFSSTTFDKNADIMISEGITDQATRPTTVSVGFERIGATVLMNLKAPTTSETISSIEFSTTQGNIAGYVEVTPLTSSYTTSIYGGGSKTITLTPASSTAYSGTIPVWFRCGAIDLNTNFTVVVNTDAKTYKKTIDLAAASKTIKFENGALTKFNVDLTTTPAFTRFTIGTEITSIFPTTKLGLKFTNTKGTGTTDPFYASPYNWYKNSDIKISAGTSGNISKVVFNFTSGAITADKFQSDDDDSSYALEGSIGTWSVGTDPVNSVTFKNLASKANFSSVDVYYYGTPNETVETSTPSCSLAITSASISVDATTTTTFTTNSTGIVTYSSDHPEYATVNSSTGVVTGVATGTARITASVAAVDDGYVKINSTSAYVDVTVVSESVYVMTLDSNASGNNNVHWTSDETTSFNYGGLTWTGAVTFKNATHYYGTSKSFAQLGSSSNPATLVTLSTAGLAGKKIVSASLTGYCTSNTGPTLTISAGTTTIMTSTSLVKTTATEYSSTNEEPVTLTAIGDGSIVTFSISNAASAGICITQIKVVYKD